MLIEAISSAASILFGFALGIFADPVKARLFSAKLVVEFADDPDFIGRVDRPDRSYVYLRGAVRNRHRQYAKSARAYLVKVERLENDEFVRIDHRDALQLG